MKQKITPFLWFDGQAEEAANFCVSIGLSWQVVPNALVESLSDPDPAKSTRAMQAMLQMKKLDIAALQRAYAAGPREIRPLGRPVDFPRCRSTTR